MSSANHSAAHSILVNEILLLIGRRYPKLCRAWKSAAGVARSMDGERVIRFGLEGGADISGIFCDGVRLEIEVKTGSGKQRDSQIAFEQMIKNFRGRYLVARSLDDVIAFLDAVTVELMSHGAASSTRP